MKKKKIKNKDRGNGEVRVKARTEIKANAKTPERAHTTHSARAPKPVGLYPHARRVGELLFLSGVGPREAGTDKIKGLVLDDRGEIISYDFEAQCHSVFKNVKV